MQYEVNSGGISVIFETVDLTAVVGDAARIDVGEAINYIKSGQVEIEQAVADGTAAFNLNASQKTIAFNNNASGKTTDFNDNATAKTGDFNTNATNKTTDFNDNYTAKKALIDAEVVIASGYANTAKQWAIGDPSEPSGGSSKYWAEQAQTTLGTKANVDLSNLSATGEAKFIKSVTTGSSNGTIKVDGTDVSVYGLGSAAYTASTAYATSAQGTKADTAVQPSDLATVATTGSYSDLLNKPTIPAAQVNSDWNANSGVAQILNKPTIQTVNDATLTIQKNGVDVQTFTANASTNATANISVPTDTGDLTNGAGFITSSAIDTMLASLYPVGSIYIGTQSTCPLASLISGSTWVKVSEGRVLQGSDSGHSAGSTIAAGLPNITGNVFAGGNYGFGVFTSSSNFAKNGSQNGWRAVTQQVTVTGASDTVSFDASRNSSIYGSSSTVQPPAYVVNIWERTA